MAEDTVEHSHALLQAVCRAWHRLWKRHHERATGLATGVKLSDAIFAHYALRMMLVATTGCDPVGKHRPYTDHASWVHVTLMQKSMPLAGEWVYWFTTITQCATLFLSL